MDIDGNTYHTISIGSQVWLMENLSVTRYRNGDSIPHLIGDQEWIDATNSSPSGGYSFFNNDESNKPVYGALYNWYAAVDARKIAPEGWHVPAGEEWETLLSSVHQDGGKLKEIGNAHWKSPNEAATNESGFTALPGGSRNFIGSFDFDSEYAYFWTTTPYEFGGGGYFGYLSYDSNIAIQRGAEGRYGLSIRCIRD